VNTAVIGAEPLQGLAVSNLLKVYTELGWGDVRDDFKKLNLELKRPPTTATVGVTTTVNSAPGVSSTQTVQVEATARKLNSSAAAVAAAERAELLMSAIHFDDENDSHGDSASSKLSEERSTQDGLTVAPTMRQSIGLGPEFGEQSRSFGSPCVLTPIESDSDPSPSPPGGRARGTEPFADDFTLESSTATANDAATRMASTVMATAGAPSSPPTASHAVRQMRLDSHGRLVPITDSPTSGKRSRTNSAVSFRDSGTPGVERSTGGGPGSVSSRCVETHFTLRWFWIELPRLFELLQTQLLH
jgi:hypothetical protein